MLFGILGVEISEDTESSPEIKEFQDIVLKLRNTVAIEHFLLEDDFSLSHEKRYEIIKNYIPKDHSKENHAEYFMSLAVPYLEDKPRQKEYLDYIRNFYKN